MENQKHTTQEAPKFDQDYYDRGASIGLSAEDIDALRQAEYEDPVNLAITAMMNPSLRRLIYNAHGIQIAELVEEPDGEIVEQIVQPDNFDALSERIRTEPQRVRKEVRYSGGNIPIIRQLRRRALARDIAEEEGKAAKSRGEYFDPKLLAVRQRAALDHLIAHDEAVKPVRRILKRSHSHITRHEPNISIRNKTAHDVLTIKKRQELFEDKKVIEDKPVKDTE
jgi:hypothetical protein